MNHGSAPGTISAAARRDLARSNSAAGICLPHVPQSVSALGLSQLAANANTHARAAVCAARLRLAASPSQSWLSREFLHRLLTPLASEAFAPAALLLFLVGLFWRAGGPAFWIFRLWAVGAALLLFLIPDALSANLYYYSLLLPAVAALGGLALAKFASTRAAYPLLAVVLVLFAMESTGTVLPLYQEDRAPRDLGLLLNRLTAPSDLMAGKPAAALICFILPIAEAGCSPGNTTWDS